MEGRCAKTYPEGHGPGDGPRDIVPSSDADGLDSGEHCETRRARKGRDGRSEVGGGLKGTRGVSKSRSAEGKHVRQEVESWNGPLGT